MITRYARIATLQGDEFDNWDAEVRGNLDGDPQSYWVTDDEYLIEAHNVLSGWDYGEPTEDDVFDSGLSKEAIMAEPGTARTFDGASGEPWHIVVFDDKYRVATLYRAYDPQADSLTTRAPVGACALGCDDTDCQVTGTCDQCEGECATLAGVLMP